MKAQEAYNVIKNNVEYFDGNSFCNIFNIPDVNKRKPGVLSDELYGNLASEFIHIRPKVYIMLSVDLEKNYVTKVRNKGVSRKISCNLTLQDFKNVLYNHETHMIKMKRFAVEKLKIFTIEQQKVGLQVFNFEESKRYYYSKSKSLAYGHRILLEEGISPPWKDNEEDYIRVKNQKLCDFKRKYYFVDE